MIWIGISTGTYGVQLWGPTILSQVLKITAQQAAQYIRCGVQGERRPVPADE